MKVDEPKSLTKRIITIAFWLVAIVTMALAWSGTSLREIITTAWRK